jgi:hypothetical protein
MAPVHDFPYNMDTEFARFLDSYSDEHDGFCFQEAFDAFRDTLPEDQARTLQYRLKPFQEEEYDDHTQHTRLYWVVDWSVWYTCYYDKTVSDKEWDISHFKRQAANFSSSVERYIRDIAILEQQLISYVQVRSETEVAMVEAAQVGDFVTISVLSDKWKQHDTTYTEKRLNEYKKDLELAQQALDQTNTKILRAITELNRYHLEN